MNLHKHINTLLLKGKNKKRAEHSIGYMNSQWKFLGCSMPFIRKTAKDIFSSLPKDHKQVRKHLHEIWNSSEIFETLLVPLIYFEKQKGKNDLSDWKLLKTWSKKIENWAHSDLLSNIYADLLERFPEKIYPVFEKWNVSKYPWQRRLSLTSLLLYSSQRKKVLPFSKIICLIKARLSDDHPYVQKAVGWTLRECHNVYPKQTKDFVKKHICDLSSIAFCTATEKWKKEEKEKMKINKRSSQNENLVIPTS